MEETATLKKRTMHPLLRIVRIILLAWVAMSVMAVLFYPRLLYHPERNLGDFTPRQLGVEYEEFWLTASDGVSLNGWRVPASLDGKRRKALLVFHGNAGNLATASHRLALYNRIGCDVFMIDYHGFGKSGGTAKEENLYLDAETAWNHLVDNLGLPPEEIVVMGYSLGGRVASWLAEKHPDAAGLILESTFTRLSDIAADFFPYLPCRLILGNAYNTLDRLKNLRMPLLVVHGRGDELVAFKYGEKLYTSYAGAKTFLRIGDDHNVGFLSAADSYSNGIAAFLDSLGGEGSEVE